MKSRLLEDISWRFGGPLGSVPPAVAWGLLAAFAAGGAIWIILSYRRTLVELPPAKRRVLTAVRLLLLALVTGLLAGPSRIEKASRARPETRAPRPLAVLIDRSESMLTPDNRRQSRADDAQRLWRTLAPAGKDAPALQTFAFAEEVLPLENHPPAAGAQGTQTHLFASLQKVLAQAPAGGWGGIVTLTDGLDTSGADSSDAVITSALQAGTPLYFVPGRNRYSGGPFLHLRDWNAPARVAPRSTFRLEVTVDSYQTEMRSVPVRLRVNGNWRPAETLRVETGHRMLLWSADIAVENAGTLPIELEIGEGALVARARAEIPVGTGPGTRILYHQGALDWGYKFLADILRRDPAFTLTPILRMAPPGARAREATAVGRPLPGDRAGYADYDVVVLANTAATQLAPAQQTALGEWVREGGVLVFLMPDDASARGFAGSELEKMLPVVFAPDGGEATADNRPRFRRVVGGGRFDVEAATLSEFAWEPAAAGIFGRGEIASPRFVNYARVLRAKPGAEVLARHPTAPSPAQGDPGRAILLAVQRYGRGQSAVLTSDALWRWKLNQPSEERSTEKFWQQLFAWLGRERAAGLRFDRPPLTAPRGQEIALRVLGSGAATARLAARRGDTTITLPASPAETGGARLFRWTPPGEGEWLLTATDADGTEASHWLRIAGGAQTGERSGAPTDEALLARLAGRTRGAVLREGDGPAWNDVQADDDAPAAEIVRPVWHQLPVFAILLGGYAFELVLRRRWRLL